MSKHLFKLLFGALFLVSATAFTGCADDDKKSESPKLTASPTALDFTDVTEKTQTVTIEANCEWQVAPTGLEWATISPMTGKGGGTITVTVQELPAGTTSREGKISFTLIHPEFGKWGTAESTVTVRQVAGGDMPSGDPIYTNDFDKENAVQNADEKWPFADAFEGWKNQTGTGAAGVTYASTSMTVRTNSPSNNSFSKYKGSGNNNMFFGSGASMEAQKIALTSAQKNLRMTLGTFKSVYGAPDNQFVTSEFHIFLSKDGAAWTEITYDRPVAEDEKTGFGTWSLATADFTLQEVPAELYIKFSSDLASAHRIDDLKLVEGMGGQNVVFGDAPNPDQVVPIASVHEATAEGMFTVQGQIVATNSSRFMLKDDTGLIEVNLGWKDNAPIVDYAPQIGQTVKVKGKTATYSRIRQINTTEADPAQITKISDGEYTQPEPIVWVAGDFTQYAGATSRTIQYIQYAGELVVDGIFYNVKIDGLDEAVLMAGIAYPAPGFITPVHGDRVIVRGYANGMTNQNKIVSFMAVEVVNDGDTPVDPKILSVSPASLTFAAAGEAKDVTVTLNSAAEGLAIEASADNAQFSAVVDGTKVTVTAVENATQAAITGALTISLMKNGSAVDQKTVTLSQSGVSGGGETTITMTFDDIKTGNTTGVAMPVNSYGTQLPASPDTWYTWSFSSLDFSGAKICESNNKDYPGTMQMQGNASDVVKQGFFGNATDLGKISKIVVVSMNTKYDPSVNLYLGTAAHPTGNVQDHPTFTKEGTVYTEEYTISGDYGFFRLWNDSVGATYIKSISITYTK